MWPKKPKSNFNNLKSLSKISPKFIEREQNQIIKILNKQIEGTNVSYEYASNLCDSKSKIKISNFTHNLLYLWVLWCYIKFILNTKTKNAIALPSPLNTILIYLKKAFWCSAVMVFARQITLNKRLYQCFHLSFQLAEV